MRTSDAERMVKDERRTTILSVHAVLRDVKKGRRSVDAAAALRLVLVKLYMRNGLTEKQAWAKLKRR